MSESEIDIPPEALEAAARELTMALVLAVDEDCRACALTDDERMEVARAACIAMLRAWPRASGELSDNGNPHIILPLTENTNAE